MVRHLRAQLAELGPVQAILVGGDVAYKGAADEYKFAKKWLADLASDCGCDEDRMFVVPGNHDVDRVAISKHMPTCNVHHAIASANPDARERTLRAQLSDKQTGSALFLGHTAYNEFAAPMNCQIYPERLFWKQDIPLREDVQLRIHGLTSTLLSGKDGADDPKNLLYLSPLQTALDPVPDVVNMVMCHHPFDWLVDSDEVEDALNRRATFQLFGHKHRQRVHREADFVRWGAGAVNPSRGERQYEPGYNLITINVVGVGADRKLSVETRQFTYQSVPEGFHPIRTSQGEDVFYHEIPFPVDVAKSFKTPQPMPVPSAGSPDSETPLAVSSNADVEAAMGDVSTRNIVARFWDLDGSQRRELTLSLDLISKDEVSLPEPERYGKALIRAKERGLLDRLAQEISKLENQ